MPNFFADPNIKGQGTYQTAPDFVLPFLPDNTSIRAGDNDIAVSFDGTNDHAQIPASAAQSFVGKRTKIWVREVTSTQATSVVFVSAETV